MFHFATPYNCTNINYLSLSVMTPISFNLNKTKIRFSPVLVIVQPKSFGRVDARGRESARSVLFGEKISIPQSLKRERETVSQRERPRVSSGDVSLSPELQHSARPVQPPGDTNIEQSTNATDSNLALTKQPAILFSRADYGHMVQTSTAFFVIFFCGEQRFPRCQKSPNS